MTLGEFNEAWNKGKIVLYDMKSERGYVSRRLKDSDTLTTGVARGRRSGEKYVLHGVYKSGNMG